MKINTTRLAAAFSACIVLGAAAQASAQSTPTPGRSTESFQDWSVECSTIRSDATNAKPEEADAAAGTKATDTQTEAPKAAETRLCEAVQTYRNARTGNEIARIAFAIGKKDGATENQLLAGLRMLVDVSFKAQPKITDGDATIMEGAFTRCSGDFCFGEFTVGKDGTKPLEDAKKATLQVPISTGKVISIGVSAKGLADALAVLKSRSN